MDKKQENRKVIIIGAGGHGRVIADIVRSSGDEVAGFLDSREPDCFGGMVILGKPEDAPEMSEGHEFIIAIGNNDIRSSFAERFKDLAYYTAVHPSAVVADDAEIGYGTVIMANAVVSTGSVVGRHCIINTAATVDHDDQIEDFVHLSPGVHLAGTVSVGQKTWIGIGAVVANNIRICSECMIGAGAAVVEDALVPGVYKGIPARRG